MPSGGGMAKGMKFNLFDVARGHVQKRRKELGQERRGSVNRRDGWRRGHPL